MALRVGQSARLRSSSRGMNTDEQATDTAALLRRLFLRSDASGVDELSRLTETAVTLRDDLRSHATSKDTFRHGGGFERVLELLRSVNPRDDKANDKGNYFGTFVRLIRNLLRLLSEALCDHLGNERYFNKHLDGWKALNASFERIQKCLFEISDAHVVARDCAALYDTLLALALRVDDYDHLSKTVERNASDAPSEPQHDITVTSHTIIWHPYACSGVLQLALRSSELESAARNETLLNVSANVFECIVQLSKISTRNTTALWRTNILSEVIRTAFSATLPELCRGHLMRLLLTLGSPGLNTLDDVAFLFDKATESDTARANLLALLRSSKEPAFVQFDLSLHGFSSIEVPRLPQAFPPSIGYALTAWVRIDEYDPNSHTTLFGAFDANQTCFVLMYLEKDSHQLILQTSIRAPNPSVRFKSTRFERSKWYHVALVQRMNFPDPSQSMASLFVNGQFAEHRKCNYPSTLR